MTHALPPGVVRRLTTWFAALAVLLAPLAVPAQPADAVTEARQHYQTGKQLFDSGDYEAAIREFEAANRLAPSPILLFNIGLAHERLGRSSEALAHFKAYLTQQPNARNRSLVEVKIARLESELAGTSAPAPTAPTPTPATPAPATPTPATPAPAAPAPQPNATSPAAPATPPPGVTPDGSTGAADKAAPPAPAASTGDPLLDRVAAVDVSSVRDRRAPLMVAAAETAAETDVAEAPPSKPAHKQIWFWVVIGVSALILLDVAFGGDEASGQPSNLTTGAPLFRF